MVSEDKGRILVMSLQFRLNFYNKKYDQNYGYHDHIF